MTTLALSWQFFSRRGVRLSLLIVPLLLAPLIYAAPLVSGGLDDLNMVNHFAEEDLDLYDGHGQYQKGPLHAPGFHPDNIYPKAFYNLAGVVLYPYAAINGDDFQVVLVVWRVLNILAAMGSVIAVFLLARRVFNSDAVAWVGALLFAVSPKFLLWTASVRPNPLELMLVIVTLYFCVRLLEGFSYKYFLLAALFSGLAFATKYGGWLFIGVLPLISVYVIWRSEPTQERWVKVVRQQFRLLRTTGPVLAVVLLGLSGVLGWLLSTHSWDPVVLVTDLLERWLSPEKLEGALVHVTNWGWLLRVSTFAALLGSVAAAAILIAMWRISLRLDEGKDFRPRPALYLMLLGLLAGQVIVIFVVAFFVAGPSCLAHPAYFVTQNGYVLHFKVLGGSSGGEAVHSFVETFQIFARNFHYGWIAFGLFLAYAGYREVSERQSYDPARR